VRCMDVENEIAAGWGDVIVQLNGKLKSNQEVLSKGSVLWDHARSVPHSAVCSWGGPGEAD
jgi:hypothetical protein